MAVSLFNSQNVFKTCPMCKYVWLNREQLLRDKKVEITGYLANFDNLSLGIYTFNHLDCKGTFSIRANYFLDLYEEEIFSESKFNTSECLGLCLDKNNLDVCPLECECSYIRHIIQIIKNWKKDIE